MTTITSMTKEELYAIMNTAISTAMKGKEEHYKGESMPFLSTLQSWEKIKKEAGEIRENTYSKYCSQMNKLCEFFKDNSSIMLSEVTEEQLQDFIVYLNTQWKPVTIHDFCGSVLNPFFKEQTDRGNIKQNPFQFVKLPKVIPSKRPAYTPEELRAIVNVLDPDYYLTIVVWLAYYTGMRREEILALTWDDVDFDNHTIHIHATNTPIRGKPTTILEITKTESSIRPVGITTGLAKRLKYHKQHVQKNTKRYVVSQKNHDKPVRPEVVYKAMTKIKQKAGITGKGKLLHTFRHSMVTSMLNDDVSLTDIQAQTGHSDLRMVTYYADDDKITQARIARTNQFMENRDHRLGI